MFVPTALEVKILDFFQRNGSPHSKKEILEMFPDAANALEGCVEKSFLEKDKDGSFILTDRGKNAI